MRNLKRALSLALASVMLLGMMVVGSSAAFSDADEIVNKEAVEITAGLGLFAGADGKFNPTGTVTRAQMATVIAKMLYGSEINADQFKGTGKFSDTVAFEGGWAEGYINLCANLGIVGGYGDGTFKPGNAVTTAEAVTMIINALGVDAGAGTWPLTVMSKAEEMKLFAELAVKPGTNVALTRDQLASVVLEGIKYSPKGATGFSVPGVPYNFDNFADALDAAKNLNLNVKQIKEVIGEDALINSVFEVKVAAAGIITDNEATKADYEGITMINGVEYAISTGLEDIGRYVEVYYKEAYKSEKEPGLTYCLVDVATKVVLAENIDEGETNQDKNFRTAFGTKAITGAGVNFTNYVENGTVTLNTTDKVAAKGTYYINNTVNPAELVSYVAPANTVATYVTKVVTTEGKETISLAGIGTLKNNADEDVVNAYDGIKKDDYVTYVVAGDMYTISPVTTVEGKITKSFTKKVDDKDVTFVTAEGQDYALFTGANNSGLSTVIGVTGFYTGTYKLYIAANGKVIGWEKISGQADLSNIVYVVDVYQVENTENNYGTKTYTVYAQGVDMEGKEVINVLAVAQEDKNDVDKDENKGVDVLYDDSALAAIGETDYVAGDAESLTGGVKGFYTFEKSDVSKAAALGVMIPKAVETEYDEIKAPIFAEAVDTEDAAVELNGKTTNVTATNGAAAYITEGTKFIMANGSKTTLTTGVLTGTINYEIAKGEAAGMLLSKNADGNYVIEIMVIAQDPDDISNGDFIYVADPKVAYTNDLGDVYNAYNNKGEKIEITVDTGSAFKGFYTYTVDAEGIYALEKDGSKSAHTGLTFDTIYNGKLACTDKKDGKLIIDHYDLTNAFIVDTRSAHAIEASESYVIETIDDLQAMKNIDKATIKIDVYDDGDEGIIAIFVTEVSALYVPNKGEELVANETKTVEADKAEVIEFVKNYKYAGEAKTVKVKVEVRFDEATTITAGEVFEFN